ncbi:MAG: hypothetical protein CMM67_04175 [Rhodospirillaceae bacterium]|nr:hypothetical protein [Rhodospirillaceae bacterium]OUT79535.1 MAG: hypothetical protein CBB83_04360 [Rhodospirillaceae bacterium TMED23]|tara:strand:+ start:1575 stop:2090 length:516 start_codon:yes stop_codon:yes gene_type:complete
MSEKPFPYHQWVNQALINVLKNALKQMLKIGPVDNHHLYITIDTTDEEVKIPGFLRLRYPEEITLVLQHQFENLVIEETEFQVSLSFEGKRSNLIIPFRAVLSFADPSINFGLQLRDKTLSEQIISTFEEEDSDSLNLDEIQINHNDTSTDKKLTGEVIALDKFRQNKTDV